MKSFIHNYWKILFCQLGGFVLSWVLVTYVFLGPLPIVQPAFRRSVAQSPAYITRAVKSLPHNISVISARILASLPTQTPEEGGDGYYPEPFVFRVPVTSITSTPLPSQTIPTPSTIPTSLPTYAPTRVPTQGSRPLPTPSQPKPTRTPTPLPTQLPTPLPTPPLDSTQFEAETLTLINKRRQENGAGPVVANAALQQAARGHAGWVGIGPGMAHCSHKDDQGTWPDGRARAAGYTLPGIGEIIACRVRSPQEAVDGWMNSQRHHDILIKPSLTEVGIGWSGPYSVALFGGP